MNNLKIKYYDEEIDVFNEVLMVENTFTATLSKIPSLNRKIFIKHGYTDLTEVETEPNINEFKVDRNTGVILFNSDMAGERVIVDYSAIGKFCVSADSVSTNVDSNGNVIETLEGFMQKNKEIIDSVNTIGDGATVLNQLEAHIESAKNLTGNIIEGGTLNDKLVKTINNSKNADTNLKESINSANVKITEMDEWVNKHGDVVNLDNRVDDVELEIPNLRSQLETIVQSKAEKTQTDNLQGQINTLVVNGTGNSNPEVVQSRVDSIGNVNVTLKDNIDSIEAMARKGITNTFIKNWTIGTLDATGVDTISTIRLRTGFQSFKLGTNVGINIGIGYKYKYYFYDKSKAYVGQTGWLTTNMDLLIEYQYYRFILSKVDDSSIDINSINAIYIKQDGETELLSQIKINKSDINKVNGEVAPLGTFKLGNIQANDTILVGATNRVTLVKSNILKGEKVGFLSSSFYNKYKFALEESGDNAINFIQSKDGAYWNEPYRSTKTCEYNFMIAKKDNTDFTSGEITEVSNNFGIISLKNRVLELESKQGYSVLYGKTIIGLGDSFIDYNTQGLGNDLLSKIAYGKNMTIHNYGLSSSSLAYDSKQTVLSVMDRYQQMLTEVPNADYVIVLAGHNDSNASLHGGTAIPIGENSDDINTTFKGALNILIKALLDKYPKAGILFLTPFNRRGTELPYVEAMKEICGLYSQVVYDNYHSSGICFQNDTHLGIYDQGNLHLNGLCNEKMAKKYIPILETL